MTDAEMQAAMDEADMKAQIEAADAKMKATPPLPQKTNMNMAKNPSDVMDMLGRAAHIGTLPLTYPAGLARSLAAPALGGKADWGEALLGNAPSTNFMRERAGNPPLPGLMELQGGKPGGPLDINTGTLLDMGLDPIPALSTPWGKAALAKLGSFGGKYGTALTDYIANRMNPLSKGLQGAGEAIYTSSHGMKAMDALNKNMGKGPVSKRLFQARTNKYGGRVDGTMRQMEDQLDTLNTAATAARDKKLNVPANTDLHRAMEGPRALLAELEHKDIHTQRDAVDWLREQILEYESRAYRPPGVSTSTHMSAAPGTGNNGFGYPQTQVTVSQPIPGERMRTPLEINEMKTSLNNDGSKVFREKYSGRDVGDRAHSALTQGLNEEAMNAAESYQKGSKKFIQEKNAFLADTLTPRKMMNRQAAMGDKKNLITSVDGIELAALMAAEKNPGWMAVKKAADLSKTNWARTKLGVNLDRVGATTLPDMFLREGMIKYNDKNQHESYWDKIGKGKRK